MEAIFYTHSQQSQSNAKKALLTLWASSGEGFATTMSVPSFTWPCWGPTIYTHWELHLLPTPQVSLWGSLSPLRQLRKEGPHVRTVTISKGESSGKVVDSFWIGDAGYLGYFFNLSASPQITSCLEQRKRYRCNNNQHLSTSKCSTDSR